MSVPIQSAVSNGELWDEVACGLWVLREQNAGYSPPQPATDTDTERRLNAALRKAIAGVLA